MLFQMLAMALRLSAFPKCYLDRIAGDRSMSVFDWIEMAKSLDADGLEMYDGFFTSLDPGYLEHAKVVLASTKNFYHRMYLGRGIFGEVTMHFRNNAYEFFAWTYPDYKSAEYQNFFHELRGIYRRQLRTICLLRDSENR